MYSPILHMELDKFVRGYVLFADIFTLKTTGGNTKDTIAGFDLYAGYRNSHGIYSSFHSLTGFVQLSRSDVVVVDSGNHCLRLIERHENKTKDYSSNCKQPGYRNGEDAQFWSPLKAIRNVKKENEILITDFGNKAIRTYNIHYKEASTLHRSYDYSYYCLVQENSTGNLYLTTSSNGIDKYDMGNFTISSVHESKANTLSSPLINSGEIVFLTFDKLLFIDGQANSLKLFDLQKGECSDMCIGNQSLCHWTQPSALMVVKPSSVFVGQAKEIITINGNKTISRVRAGGKCQDRVVFKPGSHTSRN